MALYKYSSIPFLFLVGSFFKHNTEGNSRLHFASAVHSHRPRQRRNGPVCCWMTLFAASTLQCIVNGEENCRNCPFPIEFRNRTEGGPSPRAQIFGKDCACCSGDMLADKQTHTGIQTYSSQYSATAAAGEIKITCWPYPSPDPWGKGLLLPLNQCSSAITQCQYMYNYTVSLCLKKKFPPFNCLNCL